jgi:hypothetical protein
LETDVVYKALCHFVFCRVPDSGEVQKSSSPDSKMRSKIQELVLEENENFAFLSRIVRVTGNETLVWFMHVEIKEQSKQ